MVVKAEISEADVPRVQPGQKVYFTILGDPDRSTRSRRHRAGADDRDRQHLQPRAPRRRRAARVSRPRAAIYYNGLFDVDNPDHKLRISMTAQVHIVLGEARTC